MNIYEIAQEYQRAFHELSQLDDITSEVIEDSLAAIKCELEDKAANVAAYIKNLQAESDAVAKARREMAARELRLTNKASSLSKWLKVQLEECGIKRIKKSPHFEIKVQKSPCSLDVFDPNLIPKDFIKIDVVEEIDKARVKEALKNGLDVPGAKLKSGTTLIIK
jgi:DNA repair exonuclease SbcCD ATPase subunit